MKKILVTTLVGIIAFGSTGIAEASWLSKAWNRLETSSATLAKEEKLPTNADYKYSRQYGHVYGRPLQRDDYAISGIHLGDKEYALNSLGPADSVTINTSGPRSKNDPTGELTGNKEYHYGSIIYEVNRYYGHVEMITVSKNDAVTNRGIAVGDSLVKVYEAYGEPTYIDSDNRWYYGRMTHGSDADVVFRFDTKNKKVSGILIK